MSRENPRVPGPAVVWLLLATLCASSSAAGPAAEDPDALPPWLADRGTGISTSLFGTYVEPGEWLIYPFYEYTRTGSFEYQPRELGDVGSVDYLGNLVEHEYLLFVSYGISERFMFELEGALHAKATFDKAPDDPSGLPTTFSESGLGDVEGQFRWRWTRETERRPELYGFFEVVFPLQRDKLLIGTQEWEGALGLGVLRGRPWGTIGGRIALAYDGEDSTGELGEYAFEYLKRVSTRWRLVGSLEGESDELSMIGEAQRFFGRRAILKLNCGFGLTEKAPDIAPEVGILIRL